ncbi:MAG: ATP synthase subunit I [Gallionellaceae bacterium]|nr:ATP synthase subunit I [Gallionellaceae bacterium]
MRPEYSRLIKLQGAITITGAAVAYFLVSPLAAKSVAYGGCIALASAWFLARRFQQGSLEKSADAEWHLRQAYRATIERFIWVAVMLVIGFKLLEFAPLWMLAGFLGGQAAWLAVPIWMRVENVK